MIDVGKFVVVLMVEVRMRNDRNVFSGIYKFEFGGFFYWIFFYIDFN